MIELNKVLLVGNLTRDPELRYTSSGTAVASLRLACNRTWKDRSSGDRREETLFIDVTAWAQSAEFCGKYLEKGRAVFVEGRLRQDSWEDRETGKQQSKIVVVADRIQFADPPPSRGGAETRGETRQHRAASPAGKQEAPSSPGSGGYDQAEGTREPQTEDDLPF